MQGGRSKVQQKMQDGRAKAKQQKWKGNKVPKWTKPASGICFVLMLVRIYMALPYAQHTIPHGLLGVKIRVFY
jgi:hypothetical protein